REVFVGALRHLLDGREIAVHGGVANPRRSQRVTGPGRQILGLAFDEPEWRIDLSQRLHVRSRLAAGEDVVLELVHHFVRENVLEAAEVSREGENEAATRVFSDAARSFSEIAGDVVLSELGAGGEEDDRLLFAELV